MIGSEQGMPGQAKVTKPAGDAEDPADDVQPAHAGGDHERGDAAEEERHADERGSPRPGCPLGNDRTNRP